MINFVNLSQRFYQQHSKQSRLIRITGKGREFDEVMFSDAAGANTALWEREFWRGISKKRIEACLT